MTTVGLVSGAARTVISALTGVVSSAVTGGLS